MRRFEENVNKDIVLDTVFSFLRGRKRGFEFRVLDEDGQERTVRFVRRGQDHVSIVDPLTNKPDLIPLENVIVE
jgi:hypothetical protein